METYRLQIWYGRRWKWGLNDYTLKQAENRLAELSNVGIKARIKPLADLFN